jgi:hypothetical protein
MGGDTQQSKILFTHIYLDITYFDPDITYFDPAYTRQHLETAKNHPVVTR